MIRKIIIFCAVILIFTVNVSAAEVNQDEFYENQLELSGADRLNEALPDDTRDFLNENGIETQNKDWINSITPQSVFSHIWSFLKSGAKAPFGAAGIILAIILVSAAAESGKIGSASGEAVTFATTLSASAAVAIPSFEVITSSVDALKGSAVFMTSFVPTFAVVTAASGGAATSVSMSALLLGAAQAVSFISNFVVVPLMGGYLAISLSAGASPLISGSGLADGIKKLSFWIMSLLTTVFIGILSIQTAVNASADSLSIKTARFIIGSSVPVAGTAISEALTTVTASMGLLRATVGIYGVVACCAIFLPLLLELLIWRICLTVASAIGDLFSLHKISSMLRSVDTVMSVLIGIILLSCVIFVISLTVVVSKTQ